MAKDDKRTKSDEAGSSESPKAEKGEKGDRLAQLLASDILAKIQKEYGDTILMRASDFKVQQRPRIPTGIFPYDYALGGGFPAGLASTVYGNKSAGKTTTFLRAIRNAQNMCSECYRYLVDAEWGCRCKKPRDFVVGYLDVEGTLDLPWAKSIGVDTNRLLISIPEYAEQTLDIAEALVLSGSCDILVLDSIAFLVPQKEIEESVGKDLMGVQPRLVGRGIRKLVSAINSVGNKTGRRPTLFFTNQIRFKLGVMFGNPETQPGGNAPGFAAATETKLWAGKYDMDEGTGKPISVEINYRIEKNKTSGAKMEGSYRLCLSDTPAKKKGEPFDEDQLLDWGERVGIISRSGGYQCNGETFRIKADLEKRLVEDPMFKMKLWTTVMPLLLAA